MAYPKYKREQKLTAKLSEEDVLKCKKLRKVGYTLRDIGLRYGVGASTIYRVTLSDEEQKAFDKRGYALRTKNKTNPEDVKKCLKRKRRIQGKWSTPSTITDYKEHYAKYKDTYKKSKRKWYLNNREQVLKKAKEQYVLKIKMATLDK